MSRGTLRGAATTACAVRFGWADRPSMDDHHTHPAGLRARIARHPRRRWLALVVLAAGMWLSVLNISIVNIALPSMARDLGVNLTSVNWVVTAFLVTQATLLPIAGRAGDLYGRRLVFVTGTVILIVGSLLCAVAWNAGSLIAFRIVQAVGACAMAPTAYSYVGVLFAPRERGQATGVLIGAIGFAPVVALNLAGALLAVFGWRSVFWFSPVVGSAVLVGAVLVLPRLEPQRGRRPFDLPGAGLAALGLFGTLIAISKGESWGFTSPATVVALVVGVTSLTLFVVWEGRAADPLIDRALLRRRAIVTANTASGTAAAALFGVMILLPLYMARVLGYGPVAIAIAITPIALSFLVVSPIAGRLTGRAGANVLATVGYLVGLAGALEMAFAGMTERYWPMLPGLFLFAGGLALAQSPATTVAISDVPPERLGVASSLPNISRYAGGALGTALLGVIMHAAIPSGAERATTLAPPDVRTDVAAGFRAALIAAAVFLIVATVVATRMPHLRHVRAATETADRA